MVFCIGLAYVLLLTICFNCLRDIGRFSRLFWRLGSSVREVKTYTLFQQITIGYSSSGESTCYL